MTVERGTLLVVAKAPIPGLAKTRLMARFTPEESAELAAAALLDTLRAVRSTPACGHVVALTGDLASSARADELAAELDQFIVVDQRGEGLGERLAAAHLDAYAAAPAPVFQVGMDTPQLTVAMLAASLERLTASGTDAVLGHATDGGWWGLGVTHPEIASVLSSVPMSQPDTGELTQRSIEARGWNVRLLCELADVDTPADIDLVARSVAATSEFALCVNRLQ